MTDNQGALGFMQGGLPVYDMFGFQQFLYKRPLNVVGPAQVYVLPGQTTVGLGGLIPGNFVFQSLGPNPNPSQNVGS